MPSVFRPLGEAPIVKVAQSLAGGELALFGPSTVYALMADATNQAAVERIYQIKARPGRNPMMVMVDSLSVAEDLVVFNTVARTLAARFWPGPLTLSLPLKKGRKLAPQCVDNSGYVAVCVHDAPLENRILTALGRPLACSSANRSGWLAPTRVDHIPSDMVSPVAWALDGGPTRFGLETTIIRAGREDVTLVRPGPIGHEALLPVIGQRSLAVTPVDHPSVVTTEALPHYETGFSLRLNATTVKSGETYLDFGGSLKGNLDLSPRGSLQEAAHNLYAMLHEIRAGGCDRLAVAPIPQHEEGLAINHRLVNAANTHASG